MSISSSTGFTTSAVNTGEMLNRGVEVELKATPVSTANWNGILISTMHTGITK